MRRRSFINKSLKSVLALGLLPEILQGSTTNKVLARINQQRIVDRIATLANFGRNELGKGYRVAYSKGDVEARSWLMDLMAKAGLEVKTDAAGNIIGKRKGKDATLKSIGFGSHIDMVPDGGNYDGTLGSLSALEVIEVLNENKIITRHPLEVIIFQNEEGGLFGSRAMVGNLAKEDLKAISASGHSIEEGIKTIGGDPETLERSIRKKGDLQAFIELHIEQGGILEKENKQIGVVEGIVGIADWEVNIEGFANHAGTTPMNMRQDAMLTAAKFVVAVNEIIKATPGAHVGTVGKIKALPGAPNVVPGLVTLSLEIRDLSFEKMEKLFVEIENKGKLIAAENNTKIRFDQYTKPSKPAITDKHLQQIIDSAAKSMGLSTRYMPSGAGHDTQQMALIAPVAMIFVPSVGGISHSPKEFTKAEDMANGANVLLQTILAADYQ